MAKLTIVVPIYNVEKFLPQCLDSIKAQTFTDFHVLLMNDGSKDGSLDIMKSYAAADDRFEVIDKQNEGYGKTCNRGFDMAQSEWVAIVEPDDFIDPGMYEGLFTSLKSSGASPDIVKGSYWEYYDGTDGYTESIRTPNLTTFGPKVRRLSGIEDNIELLIHHPSIWSSLYRREFINREHLRFVEVPGAGWADNPFYFAALNLASQILWVPQQYYFYRMTNSASSMYLKDFHVPFDRVREMRAFAASHHVSNKVLGVLYARELDYIDQVINKHGFSPSDPEVSKLIKEVIDSMNPDIVYSEPPVIPRFRQLYSDFSNPDHGTVAKPAATNPLVSIVLPLGSQRDDVVDYVAKLLTFTDLQYELIIANCMENDKFSSSIKKIAKKDKRARLVETGSTNLADGMNAGLKSARGRYIIFADALANLEIGKIQATIDSMESLHVRFAECGLSLRHVESLLQLHEQDPDSVKILQQKPYAFVIKSPKLHDFILNAHPNYLGNTVYEKAFLDEKKIKADESEGSSELVMRSRVLESLEQEDAAFLLQEERFRGPSADQSVYLPFYMQKFYSHSTAAPKAEVASALALYRLAHNGEKVTATENSLKVVILNSFARDIHKLRSVGHLNDYLDEYWDEIVKAIGSTTAVSVKTTAYNDFQRLKVGGREAFYQYLYLQTLGRLEKSRAREQQLHASLRYRIGTKAVTLGKKFAPRHLLSGVARRVRKG
ncbi:MAG: glycosyltransferase [Bifidobacteriaceae bacterium]|jgi:glycosyltransferase involved in cell wall biosynthesis|nr:glycosyltransferase [Bifidobacteriaceae bacterium]MCI1915210.1 glycosyltransferase [Bifidobacteriaceae bacterium]